ncbi:MAG: ABC transporter permease [Anaerolineales bacterium]|nr:ABC transporter permease [Anaerolineales bacterium]
MSLMESFRIALRSLRANKLRAALTMLGIIIGVGAVITLMSAGAAVERFVTDQFRSIGSNLLFVAPGNFQSNRGGSGSASAGGEPLTNGDVQALSDPLAAPDVSVVTGELSGGATITFGRESELFSVSGVTPEYQQVRQDARIEIGRFIDQSDHAAGSRVAVLGSDAFDDLFPENAYPIGETIRINETAFRVVGVLEPRGGSAFGSEDAAVFIPLSTAQTRLFNARTATGELRVSVIYAQAVSEDQTDAATEQIRQVLRQRHGLTPEDEDDFTVISQTDILSSAGSVLSALTVFLGAIAAISLLVGGIGIMNIMLVSVTERTREIGLRKAVGARRRDILLQFLVESVVLAVAGGALGIVLGAAGSRLIGIVEPSIQPTVSLGAVSLATGFSAAVGLFFGIYPATRAASLDPIDALRYE